MKENNLKIIYAISVSLTVFLLINPAGFAAPACRGIPLDTDTTPSNRFFWNATSFDGFCYPVNKHANIINFSWGENLSYENTNSDHPALGVGNSNVIDDEELVYTTVSYPSKQKIASKLGEENLPADASDRCYHTLAWFGKPYIAVENDATQLAPLVCKQGGSDKKCLKTGEIWELGKGYTLSVQQVDVEGDKVWFTFEKDGKELESAIVDAAGPLTDRIFTGTADIGNSEDQLYFITYVDSVFQGPVDSLAVFKYTWLVDKDNVLEIEEGDEYNGFEVKEANEGKLVLKNKNSITLKLDDKTYFTENWYFQTSDENKSLYGKGYVIYPAKDISSPGTHKLRGLPLDTGTTPQDAFFWNAMSFDGFCYPVNKHANFVNLSWGENLSYEDTSNDHPALGKDHPESHVIDDEELVYTTVSYPSKQKVTSKLGKENLPSDASDPCYHTLAWFGKPYIAVENDATQLAPLVCKQGGSAKKCLKTGEVWELGKGYTLSVQQVDVEGDKVWFTFEKDGEELESAIIDAAGPVTDRIFTGTADIGASEDQLYFITYVDSVFQGPVDSLAVFKYTWLVDKDNVLEIENGDEYNGFEVKEASAQKLVLKNKNSITLKLDDKTYFTDNWYFQASDEKKGSNGGYVIYPGMDVTVEAQEEKSEEETPTAKDNGETGAPVDIKPKTESSAEKESDGKAVSREKEKTASEIDQEGDAEAENAGKEKTPGFGLLAGILGLAAVSVRRK